jgi:PRC-barrel domain
VTAPRTMSSSVMVIAGETTETADVATVIAVVAPATSGALASRSISTTASTTAIARGCAAKHAKPVAAIGVNAMNSVATNDPRSTLEVPPLSTIRDFLALALTLGAFPMTIMANAAAQTVAAQTLPGTIEFVTTQPANQSLARVFLGANVKNPEGQTVGDINDLMFDTAGNISTFVIGVGGFLGMGEKIIAVPFTALTISSTADGARTITLKASKEALKLAPTFTPTEKTTIDAVRDKGVDLGHKTADKANELKDQAARKSTT